MSNELYRDFIEGQFDRVVGAINNELPTPTTSDIGKVVQVVSDGGTGAEYALDSVPNELPTPSASNMGSFLVVAREGTGYEWKLLTPSSGKHTFLYAGDTLGWRFTDDNKDEMITVNRTAGTVSAGSTYTADPSLVKTVHFNITDVHSDHLGQDLLTCYLRFENQTVVERYSPSYSRTTYRVYSGIFYDLGIMYRAVVNIDSTGTGTYTEFIVGGTSTPSEITMDFSPWKYGGIQEAEVASKLGDAPDTSKQTIATFTSTGDTTVHFSGIRISTNTSGNEGYFNIEVNGTNVHKQSLNSNTWQQFTNIPDIQLTNGDVITVNVGFDGTHNGCYFRITALQP